MKRKTQRCRREGAAAPSGMFGRTRNNLESKGSASKEGREAPKFRMPGERSEKGTRMPWKRTGTRQVLIPKR